MGLFRNSLLLLIILIISIPLQCKDLEKKAVVIVPVADLIGSSIRLFGLSKNVKKSYEQLAYAGARFNGENGCPRVHQLLFGEQVTIIKDDGDEWCIRITQSFFITAAFTKPQTMYWTLKENLMLLDHIKHAEKFPPPITFFESKSVAPHGVATLQYPWQDPDTGQTFSIGTRFTYFQDPDTSEYIIISLFNPHKKTFKEVRIKSNLCITTIPENHAAQRKLFLSLLKEWASPLNGQVIPYVWGGRSALHRCTPYEFKETVIPTASKIKTTVYTRDFRPEPLTGFDCAGLIMQAAQMSGIPFFYKNTYTMDTYLSPLQKGEQIQSGDIIWLRGHVLVADVQNNSVIEARGYSHGYGIIHEIPLAQVFAGIKTYDDLLRALFDKIPLGRLDRKGLPADVFTEFKVLKLESVWNEPLIKKGASTL